MRLGVRAVKSSPTITEADCVWQKSGRARQKGNIARIFMNEKNSQERATEFKMLNTRKGLKR